MRVMSRVELGTAQNRRPHGCPAVLYEVRVRWPQEQQGCASHKSFENERSILHFEWGHPQIGQNGQIGRLYHSVEDCTTAHRSGETPNSPGGRIPKPGMAQLLSCF
jgi:hypothetical protein